MDALEQCYAWDEEQFKAFLIDCPATEEQQSVLDVLRTEFRLVPLEDAFAYVKKLQAEFDLSQIPYTEEYYDPDMNAALAELKSAIDNEVWREGGEALSACQYDHSMKSTLNPIVGKLSDMRIINGELENLVFAPRKEFISMAALVVLNIPLLYFLNKDWYAALMTTVPGKAVLAVCAAAIFLSFARVVKLTQPIEYRR